MISKTFFNRIAERSSATRSISLSVAHAIMVTPLLVILVYSFLLEFGPTTRLARSMLAENQPVELLTFVVAILGGILSVTFAFSLRKIQADRLQPAFYAAFGCGLIFVAMEEISWGQWFLGFDTPAFVARHNAQQELTLHNLSLWHQYLEALPLIFALAGSAAMLIGRDTSYAAIAPSKLLLPWFAVIIVLSAIDLMHEFHVFSDALFHLVNYLDEVVELLVVVSGFLFVWLNFRSFRASRRIA